MVSFTTSLVGTDTTIDFIPLDTNDGFKFVYGGTRGSATYLPHTVSRHIPITVADLLNDNWIPY